MNGAEYRIESHQAIFNRLVPTARLSRPFGDLSLAVALAAKSDTTPRPGEEIRVVHVRTGEVVFRHSQPGELT